MHKALFYDVDKTGEKTVQCRLCPHNCLINQGKTGLCRVRTNREGELYSLVYARHTAVGMDPIEKKPLYHFYPGKQILSFGTLGCNLFCGFCQNWETSQSGYKDELTHEVEPGRAIEMVHSYDSLGIAYTYNEPLINYEWVFDTAQLLRKEGLKNVLVTNGYINEKPLVRLAQYIDAANIDVKSFNNDYYENLCKGTIGPVLRTVEILVKKGIHVEVTVLVIPGENDNEDTMRDLTDWLSSLDPDIPLHLSRYYPQYKFKKDPTPLRTLERLRNIAIKRLHYVYLGNAREKTEIHTYCANRSCNAILIERTGYRARIVGLDHTVCTRCGTENNIRL